MRGPIFSLLGALLGVALWVGISLLPIPVFLAGVAAAAAGFTTGFGMRLGKPEAVTSQRLMAVAFSAFSVVLGRYTTFLCNTSRIRLPDDSWAAPLWHDPATLRFFLTQHMTGWLPLLLFAVAGWFAWSSSRK